MKKFGQILALVFALAFGYGLGQHTQDLFATDYPGGGGGGTHPVNLATDVTGELPHGSTSDDAANVHGLPASVNVLGNRTASGEFIQRLGTDDQTLGSVDRPVYEANGTITFAVAFSANPIVVTGGAESSNTDQWAGVRNISTTAFLLSTFGINSGVSMTNIGWVALGT